MSATDDDLVELPLEARAEKAFKEAVAKAIAEHHRAGRSVPVLREGRIVELPPDKTAVAESEAEYPKRGGETKAP